MSPNEDAISGLRAAPVFRLGKSICIAFAVLLALGEVGLFVKSRICE